MKKEKNAAKEAFNATSFAKFFSGPGGRQARAVLAVLGIEGHNGHSPKHAMNPSNQTQAPIGCVEPDNPRPDLIEAQSPCQEPLRKGSIVGVGRRKQKEKGQTRPTTDERVDPKASQKGQGMLSGSMPIGGIRVATPPSQNGSTVNDEIPGSNESLFESLQNHQHKEGLMQGCSSGVATLALLGWARNTKLSLFVERQATGSGQCRPTLQPVTHVLIG